MHGGILPLPARCPAPAGCAAAIAAATAAQVNFDTNQGRSTVMGPTGLSVASYDATPPAVPTCSYPYVLYAIKGRAYPYVASLTFVWGPDGKARPGACLCAPTGT